MIAVILPVKIESTLNRREHWASRAERSMAHRTTAFYCLTSLGIDVDQRVELLLPCVVKMIRIAPRFLDDDNLVGGFKAIRDGIADWFGINDRDPRIKWVCDQQKGEPRQYACRVQITSYFDQFDIDKFAITEGKA